MDNNNREQWIKKYLKSDNPDRLEMFLDTCNEDPLLYRYRPMKDEHDFQAFEQNYFWLQNLGIQNDEEEGLVYLTYDIVKNSSIKFLKELYNSCSVTQVYNEIEKINTRMKDILKELREHYSMVCFSEVSDCDDMWKEYANNAQGICLAYSKKELVKHKFYLV